MDLSSLIEWGRKNPSRALPAWSIWNVGASIYLYLTLSESPPPKPQTAPYAPT